MTVPNDPYVVISSDCHAGLPNAEYRDWLDPDVRGAFDEALAERQRMAELAQRGFLNKEFADEWHADNEEGLRGGWEASRRDKELDADGVVGEVIFPDADSVTSGASAPFGAGLSASSETPPHLLLAGARAHNRWLAELCATSPERRAGVAVVPIIAGVDESVVEIRRAAESGLRGGILIPPMWQPHEPYHDARYDPVWAVCEELDLPIHCHSGPGAHEEYGEVPGWMSVYGYETIFFTSRPMWFMLLTGVFERFPRLRMAITEAGSFWAADMLWRLDMMATRDHGARKMADARGKLRMLPSEYFDRNCAIGSSNTRRREIARRYEIGVGNIMWGNDFPHPEGTWPYTREFLKDRFWDVPVDEAERMLGLNAAEFYNFDLDKLAGIAERIGPSPEELGQTDPSVFGKWADLEKAGRSWLSGVEALPVAG
jgi:predicted TIM-barrel fold metal-dependent hydrolase